MSNKLNNVASRSILSAVLMIVIMVGGIYLLKHNNTRSDQAIDSDRTTAVADENSTGDDSTDQETATGSQQPQAEQPTSDAIATTGVGSIAGAGIEDVFALPLAIFGLFALSYTTYLWRKSRYDLSKSILGK